MKDGSTASTIVNTPPGNIANRLSYRQVTDKFNRCAAKAMSEPRIDHLNDMIDNLDTCKIVALLDGLTEETK